MNKSRVLFWTGCVPARLLMIYIAYCLESGCISSKFRKPFVLITTLFSLSFFYWYLSGDRQTGFETFGKPIWWNRLRPIHGAIWGAYSILAFRGVKCAYLALVVDLLIGIIAELSHTFNYI